jgi:hypothetical protein
MSVLLQNGNLRYGDMYHQARGYSQHKLCIFKKYHMVLLRTIIQPQSFLTIVYLLNVDAVIFAFTVC